MSNNTVARQEPPRTLMGVLDSEAAKARITPLVPIGIDYQAIVADIGYAVRQNKDILRCAPESIIDAVVRIQQWELRIGLTAHLVPFGKTCTPIADYKGLAELMQRSGAVRAVETRVVYDGDRFRYQYGLNALLEHQPVFSAKERGRITHAYVVLRLPFGHSTFEVMTADEIDAIRKRYSKQWKEGPLPAWYAKKTVLRQAAKLIPKDPRLASVLGVIREDEEQELERPDVLPPGSARNALPAAADDEEYTPASRPALDPDDDPHFYDRDPEDDA